MGRAKMDKETVLCRAAQMVNASDDQTISLKRLAEELGIQSPSLYYYFKGLDDLKRELMLYGWRQIDDKMLRSMVGLSGYEAIKAMAHAFYEYAAANSGVFHLMLWYNQFESDEAAETISESFSALLRIMGTLGISELNACHLIRTFRSFLQGFSQLVSHGAFGNPISVDDSFEISLNVIVEGMKSFEGK